ncbi:MAG: radical SAM protein [Candidatus Planktophila sp.]|nr:radical SAM protein [Candidatus Planktophila sp.]
MLRAHQAQVASIIPFSWVDGPGNRFVLFLQGCNFNCLACHNPQTIPLHTPQARVMGVSEVLNDIRAAMPYISGITVSGGEATVQHEFVVELFSKIKQLPEFAHLTTFIDSNGNASESIWESLAPFTDGVMLDLKALDNASHIALTGSSNEVVLESIKFLDSIKKLFEVRLLLVPGHNDSDEELIKTAVWLKSVNPEMKIKINAFKTHGVRAAARDWSEVKEEDLLRYHSHLD